MYSRMAVTVCGPNIEASKPQKALELPFSGVEYGLATSNGLCWTKSTRTASTGTNSETETVHSEHQRPPEFEALQRDSHHRIGYLLGAQTRRGPRLHIQA